MDASVAGLLGAGIGAVGTALTAGVTGLLSQSQMKLQIEGQRQQAELQVRADVAGQRREPQREGYGQVLRVANALASRLEEHCKTIQQTETDLAEAMAALPPVDRDTLSQAIAAASLDAPLDMQYAAARLLEVAARAEEAIHYWAAASFQATAHPSPDTQADAVQRGTAADRAMDNLRAVMTAYVVMASDVTWALGTESDSDGVARRKRMAGRLLERREDVQPG